MIGMSWEVILSIATLAITTLIGLVTTWKRMEVRLALMDREIQAQAARQDAADRRNEQLTTKMSELCDKIQRLITIEELRRRDWE